jgi:hypothetical protein
MGGTGGWLPVTVVAVVLILGWYLSYSAARLDRQHHRVESAAAALDTQLVRRAAAALETAAVLDPATGLMLAAAASEALDGPSADDGEARTEVDPAVPGVDEEAQNDLTRALGNAFDDREHVAHLRADPLARDLLDALASACTRVQMARRFYNDAVAAAQRVRRKRVVRWARLAGRAGMPPMVEIDDSVPAGLADPAP